MTSLLLVPRPGLAQALPPDPIVQIQTPADARTQGLESLRTAIANDGGVPLPPNLSDFVVDKTAAIQLGKALFWDMQVGSDGVQACASCHFQAGADNRTRNEINPDLLRIKNQREGNIVGFFNAPAAADSSFGRVGPDGTVVASDYPFVKFIQQFVENADGTIGPAPGNTNDITSSMGVLLTRFDGTRAGQPVDSGTRLPDPVFNVNGTTVRRVEPRNTPTMINAVLNFTNFWDGRANNVFNGVNPFGLQDPRAAVWVLQSNGSLVRQKVALRNASLASQAVGPPLSHFEMSFGNPDIGNARTFPEIGKKLLRGIRPLTPLGKQLVDRGDSVLGALSAYPNRGLTQNYKALIQAAFNKKYWGFTGILRATRATISPKLTADQLSADLEFAPVAATLRTTTGLDGATGSASPAPTVEGATSAAGLDAAVEATPSAATSSIKISNLPIFTQMEANFSLFFGIAVMLYESTLIADQSPFDAWMETGTLNGSFTADALAGLNLFVNDGHCIACHGGPELSNASVRNAQNGKNVIEPMLMARGTALYDNGFYNISVVPTTDDPGRGGKDLNGKPLAFSRQALFERVLHMPVGFPITGNEGIPVIDEDGNAVCTDTSGNGFCDPGEPLDEGFRRAAVDGAFKTPQLRNQALLGPYMHNGGFATLRQVVEFYNRGGNFCQLNIADFDPDVEPRRLSSAQLDSLVSFLISLTDPRVPLEQAPFDHPELFIANAGLDETGGLRLPQVGKGGVAPAAKQLPFLNLDPRASIFTPVGECSVDEPPPPAP